MLVIHGVTRSRASRLIWLCHEIGLDYRQEPVIQAYRLADPMARDAPLNTRTPAFLALSPAGAIPVIEDDGLVLSESMACTLYLARKHGLPLGPADAAEDALMMQWSFFAATAIEPDALTVLFLGDSRGSEDRALVANAAERLMRPLQVLEDHLSRGGQMVGNRFTVADINVAEVIRYAQGHDALMARFPSLIAWLQDCQKRPAFQTMWAMRQAEPA
ncbi:glutathione S-transferase family protein [Paracoccus sp. TK19116]|uniref:Glutathione S-transferase family protein n=1 Tax=Paracoccus albicereus TaxID=2922394 RepID=A0ABT1MQY5_9RHOB|nr:glutathione S-transferase family protein [Paracoccus albicereus]MCQ0969936.1 glutathione S-transferase family protein [Paracoccus albicereus]